MLIAYKENYPSLSGDVYMAPGCFIIGNVRIDGNSSVWFSAVVRGDMDAVTIGEETNIQDNCTIHTDLGSPVKIGHRVTVGHNSVIHGCTIEDDVLIGMGAVILNGACIKQGAVIGAGSVVTAGTVIPPYTLALGSPAKIIKETTEEIDNEREITNKNYLQITEDYRRKDESKE